MATPSRYLVLLVLAACGDDAAKSTDTDASVVEPQALGMTCRVNADCISRVCLTSQYGTPFCTRPCDAAEEPCEGGADLPSGQALCISFENLPNPDAPAFEGTFSRFCVPRCGDVDECTALDPAWEECDRPQWLGDPIHPNLGNVGVCQSPSFHGKAPVDPSSCDWEPTIKPQFTNEAGLCRSYCAYLDTCDELVSTAGRECCEWGCYNRIVVENTVVDAWSDNIECYLENHAAFPDTGPVNSCTEPPKKCGGIPTDPTPPAARPK